MHICTFTAGLDDMKRKDQRDPIKVLRVLSGLARFSVFEATENAVIARTMTDLDKWGLIRTTGGAFPWHEFEITDAGRAALEAGAFEPPKPAPMICRVCGRDCKRDKHVVCHGDHEKPTCEYTCADCWLKAKAQEEDPKP